MRLFVTGASGFIGAALVRALIDRGDRVVALTRAARAPAPGIEWVQGGAAEPGAWQRAAAGCHAIVHLAGENIAARRWNPAFKKRLRDSRIDGTRNVVAALAAARAGVLVSANGVDWYPDDQSDTRYPEEARRGPPDAMTDLCADWQREALEATAHGARVVLLRTGLILGRDGGVLERLLTPFKLFAGGPLGSGRQWFSWMHMADCVGSILHALDRTDVRGPLNQVAPEAVRQKDFARALGRALGRPSFLPAPRLAVKAVFGEIADHLVKGRLVIPALLERTGYRFKFPKLADALQDLVGD